MLVDRYSPTPYHYAKLKVGHLPSVRRQLFSVKRPLPVTFPSRLRPTLNCQY